MGIEPTSHNFHCSPTGFEDQARHQTRRTSNLPEYTTALFRAQFSNSTIVMNLHGIERGPDPGRFHDSLFAFPKKTVSILKYVISVEEIEEGVHRVDLTSSCYFSISYVVYQ